MFRRSAWPMRASTPASASLPDDASPQRVVEVQRCQVRDGPDASGLGMRNLPRNVNVSFRATNRDASMSARGREQTSVSRRHERQVSGGQSGLVHVCSGSTTPSLAAAKKTHQHLPSPDGVRSRSTPPRTACVASLEPRTAATFRDPTSLHPPSTDMRASERSMPTQATASAQEREACPRGRRADLSRGRRTASWWP
jgi:hypothetical protein